MNLIIFPGNSVKNKEWLEKAEQAFSKVPEITSIYKHYYKHWETGEEMIDLEEELKRFTLNLPFTEPYVVFAKSAGSLLTLLGKTRGIINPDKAVFVGMPISWAKTNNVPFEFEDWNTPTLVIQNDHDPITSAKDLREAVSAKTNFTIVERVGDNHDYLDFEEIVKSTRDFFGGK